MTTVDLSDFGNRELGMAADLLAAYAKGHDSPFFGDKVQVMMNQNSGNVFLTDEDCNVLMLNGEALEDFFSSPYEGKEGFFDDLLLEYAEMHTEDKEWFRSIAEALGRSEEIID